MSASTFLMFTLVEAAQLHSKLGSALCALLPPAMIALRGLSRPACVRFHGNLGLAVPR